jgi:hypothetical protein
VSASLPVFPDIGCRHQHPDAPSDGCGFERRGAGWQCVEGEACGRYIHPGDEHHDAVEGYDRAMLAAEAEWIGPDPRVDSPAHIAATARPTEREVALARGLLAILRTHEEGGDPETWEVSPAAWGDGRTTWELHENHTRKSGWHGRGLVCQFRPDDVDGTEQDAKACVSAAQAGLRIAREVLAKAVR